MIRSSHLFQRVGLLTIHSDVAMLLMLSQDSQKPFSHFPQATAATGAGNKKQNHFLVTQTNTPAIDKK
jgi:hypothetical protein